MNARLQGGCQVPIAALAQLSGEVGVQLLDEPPAEESFEATDAFAWLTGNAGDFGFQMSYPRDNPHGITYEPWHWCHRP